MIKYLTIISMLACATLANAAKDNENKKASSENNQLTHKNWRDRIEESANVCDVQEKTEMPRFY